MADRRRRLFLSAVFAILFATVPLGAQTPSGPAADVLVKSFTPWNDPDKPFRFELSVANIGTVRIEDLRVRLTIYRAVGSRSALRAALDGRPQRDVLAAATEDVSDDLEPAARIDVPFERTLGDLASRFRRSGANGVYPVEIQVRGSDRELWSGWAAIVFFASPPEKRLNVTWVLPVHHPSGREPDGTYQGRAVDRFVGPGGTLLEASQALADVASLPVTLAPTPLLLDELADLADGYRRRDRSRVVQTGPADGVPRGSGVVLARLKRFAESTMMELATVPYGRADLVPLVHAGLDADAQRQLEAGAHRTEVHLGRTPNDQVLVPANLNLDARSAALAASLGVRTVVVDGGLVPPPAPFGWDRPARVRGVGEARLDALLADPPIRERLDGDQTADPVLRAQAVLAETASSYLERPAHAPDRALVVASSGTPPAATISALAAGFTAAPWVSVVSASQAVQAVPPPDDLKELPLGQAPADDRTAVFRSADRALDVLGRVIAEPQDATEPLERRVLAAQSADWIDGNRGIELARAAKQEADRIVGKIDVAQRRVTLTSRTGQLPITVINGTEYTIGVRVRLSSVKVEFPDGADEPLLIGPGRTETITFPAKALAAGAFGVGIELRTPDGAFPIGAQDLVVRSTAVSAVALIVIAGGIVVMLVAWFRRGGHKRGGRRVRAETPSREAEPGGSPQPA